MLRTLQMFDSKFEELDPHDRQRVGGKVRLSVCRDRCVAVNSPTGTAQPSDCRTAPARPPVQVGGSLRGGGLAHPERAPEPPAVRLCGGAACIGIACWLLCDLA